MQHYSALTFEYLDTIHFEIVTTNKKDDKKQSIKYLNVPAAFDIETTSYTNHDGNKVAFMWVWAFSIGEGKEVFYGRTWEDFLEVCGTLQRKYQLGIGKRLVIYVHNLGFEFQFMKHWFSWVAKGCFSIDKGMPVKMLSTYGIEFRCSWKLTNSKLSDVARNLINADIKKMEGDLDYDLVRHHKTPFTEKEAGYIENDVLIVTAQIAQEIKDYGDVSLIPMTNTGRVRKYIRDKCYPRKNKHVRETYSKIIKSITLTTEVYEQLKQTFIGGFTHSNPAYTGLVLGDVSSFDIASSYPAVLASERYPMGKWKPLEPPEGAKEGEKLNINLEGFLQASKVVAFIMKADIKGLRNKIGTESYMSESKCYNLKGAEIFNGRVFNAESLTVCLTEVDLKIMMMCYEWDSIAVYDVYTCNKAYLPKPFLQGMLKLYADKTQLKGVKGREADYMRSKGMLNSLYGMCVTDIVKDSHKYMEEGWTVEEADPDASIESYNKKYQRFLSYSWGVYVTAYARYNLWKVIVALGEDYIYSDTDSVKILNAEKHKELFESVNQEMIDKLNAMCELPQFSFDKSFISPKTIKGESKTLGVWEYEGTYDYFKTLGAKRYMTYKDGDWQLTVAGLSKRNGMDYLIKLGENNPDKIFSLFNNNLYIPANETGKKTHTTIDTPYSVLVTDYLGNTEEVTTLSGLHLSECEFTLSISEQMIKFMENVQNGQRYLGEYLV